MFLIRYVKKMILFGVLCIDKPFFRRNGVYYVKLLTSLFLFDEDDGVAISTHNEQL